MSEDRLAAIKQRWEPIRQQHGESYLGCALRQGTALLQRQEHGMSDVAWLEKQIDTLTARITELETETDKWRPKVLWHEVKRRELEAARARLAAALEMCAEWLESRPDYTDGDAATSSAARSALTADDKAAAEELRLLRRVAHIMKTGKPVERPVALKESLEALDALAADDEALDEQAKEGE